MEIVNNFIKKANIKHNYKYDYSKVDYKNSLEKVCIICPEHGEFWQTPQSHVRGEGCPKCANSKRGRFTRLTTDEFIKKAIEIHGGKYDYSKVNYFNSTTKVCIICPEHGEFWQTPINHIYNQKQGCPKCAGKNLSTEEVINRFKNVHGDKYDYSKVEYNKMHEKVCIICPEHGEFWQTPAKHILGQECPKCAVVKRAKIRTKTTDNFINEAIKIHGNKYNYSKTKYKGALKKVTITCPVHGDFLQTPNDHLNGHGCGLCCQSTLETEVKTILEENNITFESQKKFDWLYKQSLDFYLPEYNIAIECQGIQHFKPIEYFGWVEGFNKIIERDVRKRKLCEKNNIKLLYYSKYKEENCITDASTLLKNIK